MHRLAEIKKQNLIEANAGTRFQEYVMRKGFLGVGGDAHKFSYHLLKHRPFRAALSKHIVKKKPHRRLLLLNGVRVEESENRMDNYGDNPYRADGSKLWVNIIHWFLKTECLSLLEAEGVQRSPVAIHLGRSGECNCGTMQNEAARIACREYDPEWGDWMWSLRKAAIQKFGWDIGQTPNKKRLAEIKAEAALLSADMPMCVGCKSKWATLFDEA